jgi:hypothetical protein
MKRPLLNSVVTRDWVFWAALLIAGISAYSSRSASAIEPGGFVSLDSYLDAVVNTSISFGLISGLVGLIRRRNSSTYTAEHDYPAWRKSVVVIGAPLLVALGVVFADYSNSEGASASDKAGRNSIAPEDVETVPRTCQPRGEDEICIEGIGYGESASLDMQLIYSDVRAIDGLEIASSRWKLYVDCSARTVVASNLQFLDSEDLVIEVGQEVLDEATIGIQSDYQAVLTNCD